MIEIVMTKGAIAAGAIGVVSVLLTVTGLLSDSSPIVTVEEGQLQGLITFSRNGDKFFEFLGIPYAHPPVKELRYEAPIPSKSWDGVKQVTKYPPFCYQFDSMVRGRIFGTEDCLYLNVFTKSVDSLVKKPVLVYVHGGGFLSGAAAMYRPNFLMDEDIVLVTLNYRLGPLGFANVGEIRGNMGLKDQNLALKWVKKNIEMFGGDSDKITLFGESAGAASVQYHLLSPASQGLFHKAIIQSGAVTCPWSLMGDPQAVTLKYVNLTGCPTSNHTEMVSCLKEMDAEELVKLQFHLMDPTNDFLMFVPSIETVQRPDTFLSENPRKILKEGRFPKIPVLMGVTSGEGALRTARFDAMPERITELESNWTELAPTLFLFLDETLSRKEEVSTKIREYYFGTNSFTDDLDDFKIRFSKMNSDGLFFEPVHRAAKLHAEKGSPTYLYYYNYDSVVMPSMYSLFRAVRPDDWLLAEIKLASAVIVDLVKENILRTNSPYDFGATHADDLFQLWNLEGWTGLFTGADIEFSSKFVKMFADFARDENSLEFGGIKWPPIKTSGKEGSVTPLQYMLLGKEPKVIEEPFAERVAFWESLQIRNER